MKSEINRKDLTANILNKVIIRLDFLRIVNIQELVSELQGYLSTLDFFLTNQDFVNDIEFQINDPEILSTDNFSVKKSIKREQIYNFENTNNTVELAISENFIAFNIDCKREYSLEKYITIFSKIVILAQKKFTFIKFIRIGLRKINNIICKDENLYYCFEKDFLPDIKIQTSEIREIRYMKRQALDNLSYNKHLFNIFKIIQEGTLGNKNTERAFNAILDIDGYLKETIPERFEDYDDVKKTIIGINYDIFDIFKSMITYNFANDLIKGESNKVEWGINKNDKI
ncbi:TIGR04255 family protein [Clostridium botulinum]|uniref:TIGR04255 family protein n=1 Tax=Clostridium botulinum TaxID=1491 RepID=A0A846J456_CLOBO|nr:TIGR04255 family protein [Clostridium botulinum]ACA56197.1 hypothetical protein CLK_1306 [Clostridium botulinum A3 str. Loch Maree]NFJ08739.1 TIGR04255 family protein [Clostridium botulinum]NFK15135.1 TIGR04255 family protein [Clostridium botulinum]NFM93095.1 TIGR04255 family protein [Clostridium botulinum]NFO18742.1 TIGR04255 family protein [Clostridium botulinum]